MPEVTPPSVEMPSGKDAGYENFPVGSWLLPAKLRPHIAVFYRFARAIDDIADSPDLTPEDKVERLKGFEKALLGGESEDPAYLTAHKMRRSLADTGVTPRHCQDLIAAFIQDVTKLRYKDWDDLMGYCLLSAAPVGRYLLDIHGGSRDGYGPSDALCAALQVINHLQDCRDDYRQLDRVYLPMDWMAAEGALVEDLDAGACSPSLRAVIDRMIRGVDGLMPQARMLAGGLRSRRLAMESAAIVNIAESLSDLLRRRDPLGPKRIKLTKAGYVRCVLRGVLSVMF